MDTDPDLQRATVQAGDQLVKFVEFLKTLVPELRQFEATFLAACILENLPAIFAANPEFDAEIKKAAQQLIELRNQRG